MVGWDLFLLVGRYVPTKVIRVYNKDKHLFDDQCRHAFGLKQEEHLRWTRDRSRVNTMSIRSAGPIPFYWPNCSLPFRLTIIEPQDGM